MGLRAVVVVVLAVFGGVVGAGPAQAVPVPEAPAAACSPTLHVLPTVDGPTPGTSAVHGLSLSDEISVGESNGLPVYWVGDVLHRVPLPTGYGAGAVLAVNRFGLMVGYAAGAGRPARAFRYFAGNPVITFYPKGSRAVDVNDAGRAVGVSDDSYDAEGNLTPAALWELGPGARVRRQLELPAGYEPYLGNPELDSIGINNGGYIIATGSVRDQQYGDTALDSFTWSAAANSSPVQVQLPHAFANQAPGLFTLFDVWVAVAIDNNNRMVGYYDEFPSSRRYAVAWDSRRARPTGVGYNPPLDPVKASGSPVLVALSDRSGLAAGYATVTPDLRGGLPPDRVPDIAIARVGSGPAFELPRLYEDQPSRALAAQDDRRVGGWADGRHGQEPVVWTCVA